MGYDMRLYVVEKFDTFGYEESVKTKHSCLVYAQVELCCVGNYVTEFRNYPETDCYIYVNDEPTSTDRYGQGITEIPIDDAIKTLRRALSEENYARYEIALGLLEGVARSGRKDNLVVLQYGH